MAILMRRSGNRGAGRLGAGAQSLSHPGRDEPRGGMKGSEIFMIKIFSIAVLSVMLIASASIAQTTQPAASDTPKDTLEFRASQAFNRNEYSIALPLLQKLETQLKDTP